MSDGANPTKRACRDLRLRPDRSERRPRTHDDRVVAVRRDPPCAARRPAGSACWKSGAGQGGLGAWLVARVTTIPASSPTPRSRPLPRRGSASLEARPDARPPRPTPTREPFDLVCAFEVLEHIEDDAQGARRVARTLEPDGRLLLSVPAHAAALRSRPTSSSATSAATTATRCVAARSSTDSRSSTCAVYGAGLGNVLDGARQPILRRQGSARTDEERTAGSGRLFQPKHPSVCLRQLRDRGTVPRRPTPFAAHRHRHRVRRARALQVRESTRDIEKTSRASAIVVFVALVLVFFVLRARRRVAQDRTANFPSLARLVAAGVLWCARAARAARTRGPRCSAANRLDHGAGLLVSQLAKYVPGGIWQATRPGRPREDARVSRCRAARRAFSVLALTPGDRRVHVRHRPRDHVDRRRGPCSASCCAVGALASLVLLDRRWMVWALHKIPRTRDASAMLVPAQRLILLACGRRASSPSPRPSSAFVLAARQLRQGERSGVRHRRRTPRRGPSASSRCRFRQASACARPCSCSSCTASIPTSVLVATSVYHRLVSVAAEGIMAAIAVAPGAPAAQRSSAVQSPTERRVGERLRVATVPGGRDLLARLASASRRRISAASASGSPGSAPGRSRLSENALRIASVSPVTTGRPTASTSNTLFGTTRRALSVVPKMPRHSVAAAISSESVRAGDARRVRRSPAATRPSARRPSAVPGRARRCAPECRRVRATSRPR